MVSGVTRRGELCCSSFSSWEARRRESGQVILSFSAEQPPCWPVAFSKVLGGGIVIIVSGGFQKLLGI